MIERDDPLVIELPVRFVAFVLGALAIDVALFLMGDGPVWCRVSTFMGGLVLYVWGWPADDQTQ